MAAIVVLHGVGKQYLSPGSVHESVSRAVLTGLESIGVTGLSPEDIAAPHYGHWFLPRDATPVKSGPATPLRDDDLDPWEAEVLRELWAEAARLDPHRVRPPGDGEVTKAPVPRLVQLVTYALNRAPFMARGGMVFLRGDLRQARSYLRERAVHRCVQQELAAVIDDDTRVLVGHSLGSVIAYEALAAHPEWPVRTLVTLGSPLGMPTFFRQLVPRPEGRRGAWPGSVVHWANLCDRHDFVALHKNLDTLFGDGTRKVDDDIIDNGWKVHALERHLEDRSTAKAIAAGLGT
ncbi:alpha/beta fold hydrolase [Streptomyces coeruleoprunus]|uniref:Alpha/beta fold hydrolase n=1 Tax=Streptomyces coeruleoprunus TaxID=285563 RepID=A0ABV9XBV4_9ACTN